VEKLEEEIREEEEEGLFKAKAVNEVDDDVTPRRRRDPPTNRRRKQPLRSGTICSTHWLMQDKALRQMIRRRVKT
jgi:hypothetical protein